MKSTRLIFGVCLTLIITMSMAYSAENTINVFTWEGYVEPQEVDAINKILNEKGYDFTVKVIDTWAEGPEQMFDVIRSGVADISFLTLNYIDMQDRKIGRLLQPINVNSPRIPNHKKLNPTLKDIPFGMHEGKHLYVPWGGGAYGIWANMDILDESELPGSVKDLWDSKWKGRLSLTEGQIQPNISLVMMALDKPPFYLNNANRADLIAASQPDSEIQLKTNALYSNVGFFWGGAPDFSKKELVLVSSYGIGAFAANRLGGNWKLIPLKEGNTIWLDTINIHKDVQGKKLEAVEEFINYWLGAEVQNRLVNELGMVSSTIGITNPLLDNDPNFFRDGFFWPPWKKVADNTMQNISKLAIKNK
jgi:spermidine/putrescine-binding protein